MRNLARLNAGARNQIKRCLEGKEYCLICVMRGNNTPSTVAVGSYNGWYPACEIHGKRAEIAGYEVIRQHKEEGRENKLRQVIYKSYSTNVRGEEYGSPEEKRGLLIAFTPDYKFAVIETSYGEIIQVSIDRVRYSFPLQGE